MKLPPGLFLVGLVFAVSGCTSVVQRVGISVLYKRADWPEARVRRDIPYCEGSNLAKQRLDLFLPKGHDWPVFIFVHGGGWTTGDKALRVGGADVYGNIGRYLAARGIGVAVISYRLLPGTGLAGQVDDVAQAAAWVHNHIAGYGGDPRQMFIGGHSAGAQLADRIALDPRPLQSHGLSPHDLSGVISVSGAGLDLTDETTYQLGASRQYYEQRFGTNTQAWRESSPVTYVQPGAPPFLILYAGGETKALQRQSRRLQEVLSAHGVKNQLVVVPGQSHTRIVLALSRPDKTAGPAMLNFLRPSIQNPAP